ncbi:phytoene/squalene synthase family protein [Streptomyces spongiae]|uniref:Phytoene/squalene synthetase n=1 Tax=Streptomyces spongiae TaxID=565072 RepID=A0A5N8XNC8_9ACTN|nr:squalene/phytoene synthase family protein [Streptomyces spongiae]MPY60909.1 phytoene/squalene synthetase [Streptomyces spongiae]
MGPWWGRALDAAGIDSARLRADYTRQRRTVARHRPSSYLAARLLVRRELLPHLLAVTAFMDRTDTLLDSGPPAQRATAFAHWEQQVREGLAGGTTDHPDLRPLLHTITVHPPLRARVTEFLTAAPADLDFAGFATEEDYQEYVDAYTLPAFMLIAGLLAGEDIPAGYREACRTYIDGSQRLDFVNDLAEDLAEGRLNLPQETLDTYGVTRADLESGRDTSGTRALLAHVLDRARRSVDAGRPMADLVAPEGRPLFRAMIGIEDLTARAAQAKGAALLRGPARPPLFRTLRLLFGERARARRSPVTAGTGTVKAS